MTDLENHVADWWTPLHLEFRDHDIYTPSPPAGAFPMLERLGMMDLANSRELGHNSLEYLHTFAEITKMAYWDRLAYSSDPDIGKPPFERLLATRYWQERIDSIDPAGARDFDYSGIVTANSENTTPPTIAKYPDATRMQDRTKAQFGSERRRMSYRPSSPAGRNASVSNSSPNETAGAQDGP